MIVGAVWQNICMSENQDGNRMLCVISRTVSLICSAAHRLGWRRATLVVDVVAL